MRIRAAEPGELSVLQDIERGAGQLFREIGMPEIAEDEPLSLHELAGYQRAGRAWVAADGVEPICSPTWWTAPSTSSRCRCIPVPRGGGWAAR
jgi:hypothetical protein